MTWLTRAFRAAGWTLAGLLTFLSLWWGPALALNAIEPAAQAVGLVVFATGLVAFAHLYARAWWVAEGWWQKHRIHPWPFGAVDPLIHVKVGDPDPNVGRADGTVCDQVGPGGYRCTRNPDHVGAHIAGDGEEACAVWSFVIGGAP